MISLQNFLKRLLRFKNFAHGKHKINALLAFFMLIQRNSCLVLTLLNHLNHLQIIICPCRVLSDTSLLSHVSTLNCAHELDFLQSSSIHCVQPEGNLGALISGDLTHDPVVYRADALPTR